MADTPIGLDFKTMSTLVARAALANAVGYQYNRKRDMYKALGYPRRIEYRDYFERYERNGIASRIVDAPAKATWRTMPTVTDVNNPDKKSRFEKAWYEISLDYSFKEKFEQVDRLAGLGDFAVLYIGTNGRPEDQVKKLTKDNFYYLTAFSPNVVKIHTVIDDPRDPRYGLPEFYKISFKIEGTQQDGTLVRGNLTEQKVHWTRVIHVAENALADELYGTPMLKKVWNYLDDLDKIIGGTAEAVWRVIDRGIQFDVDKDAELEDAEALTEQIENYMHGIQRYIRTQGITANPLGADAPDPTGAFAAVMAVISGTTGIPQRILTGSERGQLASTQDRSSWAERILERQNTYAEPVVLRPLIDRFIELGLLPKPKKDRYEICWQDLMKMTELERATVARHIAMGVQKISEQYGQPTVVVATEEFRELVGLNPTPPEVEVAPPSSEPDPSDRPPGATNPDEEEDEENPDEEVEGEEESEDA